MQIRLDRITSSHPLPIVLALTGAALVSSGCAGSEDPGTAPGESTGSAVSASTEGTSNAESTPAAEGAGGAVSAKSGSAAGGGVNLFHAPQPWTRDVSSLPRSDKSERITGWLSD